MIAPCNHTSYKKDGKNRNGTQRYKCKDCGIRFSDDKPLGTMRTSVEKAAMALSMMLEGMSVRATERLTGLCRQTICDLILVAGEKCQNFSDATIVDVQSYDIQCDEIWSFCGMKQKHAKERGAGPEVGDSWTFVAVDRDTKMILATHIGKRDVCDTDRFLMKLACAVDQSNRIQISTDGWSGYQLSLIHI